MEKKYELICNAIESAESLNTKEEYGFEDCYHVYQGELKEVGFTIISLELLNAIKEAYRMWPEIEKGLPQGTDKEQGQSQAIFVAFHNLSKALTNS